MALAASTRSHGTAQPKSTTADTTSSSAGTHSPRQSISAAGGSSRSLVNGRIVTILEDREASRNAPVSLTYRSGVGTGGDPRKALVGTPPPPSQSPSQSGAGEDSPSAETISNTKPALFVEVDSPGMASLDGQPSAHSKASSDRSLADHRDRSLSNASSSSAGVAFWQQQQQPYSELSRLPSASYRFRGANAAGDTVLGPGVGNSRYRDGRNASGPANWQPEGSQKYMTPLPSPLEMRSRSISDAGSEMSAHTTSVGGLGDKTWSAAGGGSTPRNPLSQSVNAGATPARSRTKQFFDSAESILSPPPPPRIASANYDHSKRNLEDGHLAHLARDGPSHTIFQSPVVPAVPDQAARLPKHFEAEHARAMQEGQSDSSAVASAPSTVSLTSSLYQPLSNLPSAIRAEPRAVPFEGKASHIDHTAVPSDSSSEGPPNLRLPNLASTLLSGREGAGALHDSPVSSPTESTASIASAWIKEAPVRLPTLDPRILESALLQTITANAEQNAQDIIESHSPPTAGKIDAKAQSHTTTSKIRVSQTHTHERQRIPSQQGIASPDHGTVKKPPQSSTANANTLFRESEPGHVLGGEWQVIRNLGLGAFSRVVLAKRIRRPVPTPPPPLSSEISASSQVSSGPLSPAVAADVSSAIGADGLVDQPSPRPSHKKSSSSLGSKKSYPTLGKGHIRGSPHGLARDSTAAPSGSALVSSAEGDLTASSSSQSAESALGSESSGEGMVEEDLKAVKMINRSHISKNDRMRISIVREVEVLKHIRHPSLVDLTTYFDTPYHTCLVLDYSPGGELFDFVADFHELISEVLVRRIFGELADVLGWMHSIGLVHRDIKLENILLTSRPFSRPSTSADQIPPSPDYLPSLPTPFVKLTDFGLSRFVDLSSPHLETRCGSEEYAAPELIMGKRYDGRQTDAWALGVVLYALITGSLPFTEDSSGLAQNVGTKPGASPSSKGSTKSRRAYLLKIAKGEYRWPDAPPEGQPPSEAYRLVTESVQSLVGSLLCRDAKKRARADDVWDAAWMSQGPGAPTKRSTKGGTLEGVSVAEFEREDERGMVTAEIPDGDT